ncbi:MAG: iron-containing alcohol dehydrogenase [Chloroflexi bacterium]|nr:iron-containing alcohol dehydrogenase [Chloroflexota bacterium]
MKKNLNAFLDSGATLQFGSGKWNKIKRNLLKSNNDLIVVTSKSCKKFITDIPSKYFLVISEEPSLNLIDNYFDEISKIINKANKTTYIALGGGSVVDTAKILSLMVDNNIKSSKEAIKKTNDVNISEESKIICIPSTAGTGAEITPFSTIWDKENGIKYSIIANKINREIILDPEISISLPEKITISTGIDSLCQILESTWSKKANDKSLSAASLGFEYVNKNFYSVINNPIDAESRKEMLFASFLSGISISISNTTLCHSISYPLTSLLNVPHGIACGLTLVEVIKFNSTSKGKFLKNTFKVANVEDSESLVKKILLLFEKVKYKNIIEPYITKIEKNINKLLPLTISSRASNNPINATINDVEKILKNSLDYYK